MTIVPDSSSGRSEGEDPGAGAGGRAARPRAAVGTTVDRRFELLAFAAAGGMGRVYRARDLRTGATVAVKLLAAESAHLARFEREADVLAAIDHPGVVRHVAHGATPDGGRYLAMEWLDGEDLSERIAQGLLDVPAVLAVARAAADGLAAAHRRGVVHRDLKPPNLFLVERRLDAVKVIDFGIARTLVGIELTLRRGAIGTPGYMAPEQVRGDPVDARADVYGLGAVMYCCLAGRAPFRGAHAVAVLAKIVLEEAPSIREARPDVSPEVAALIARLLAKDPADRPRDAAAVVDAIAELARPGGTAIHVPAAITAREQRLACVVLCPRSGGESEATLVMEDGEDTEEIVRDAVERRGGVLDALARGAWVVTIPHADSPAEGAVRAARCALALAEIRPTSPVIVATGRVLVSGAHQVGEVIDRAADALVAARDGGEPGGVRVDAATAELLEGRFRLVGDGPFRALLDEEDAIAPVRTLLGRPTACIGREPELAALVAAIEASRATPRAAAALVSAAPGLGKTRLLHEVLAKTARDGVDVLFSAGDPLRAASAFGIAAQIVARAARVADADPPEARAAKLDALVGRDAPPGDAPRIREFLGEICGAPTPRAASSPELRAARADVSIMADGLREAWTAWLATRAGRTPTLLVLEDVHWADASSLRLVEAALAALEDLPIFLLATARAEGGAAPRLRTRGLVEVTLAPLSPRASERLVRGALGDAAADALVAALARRAAGHPFHLEELVRAVADGRGPDALPDSVFGMVQARLDRLDASARRLLRAASVFGEGFSSAGVTALMGDDARPDEVRTALAALADREILLRVRASRREGDAEYQFRHALLRDAAYAMLAESDRTRAHGRAAAWLESVGEQDPVVLAEHHDRSGAPDRAIPFFRRAAEHALQRNDFDRALGHTSRAHALRPDTATAAALAAVEAEVSYWRGDLPAAAAHAEGAAGRSEPGTTSWFDAASIAIAALGQLGKNDDVAAWLRVAARASTPSAGRGAHVVALCRGVSQLDWAHHGDDLRDVRARLDELVAPLDGLDPHQLGWVHRVRGESAWLHARDVDTCLSELAESCAHFERARATRALCLTRLNAGTLRGWAGDTEGGLELVAASRAEAERLGATFLSRYARVVEASVRAFGGDAGAADALERCLDELRGSPRLSFLVHVFLGWLELDRGRVDAAAALARGAADIAVVPDLRPGGLALAARVALARGDLDEAVRLADEGERLEVSRRDLELTHGLAGLVLARALQARGDAATARTRLDGVTRRLRSIASGIESPAHRGRFFSRRLGHADLVTLALELGVDSSHDPALDSAG